MKKWCTKKFQMDDKTLNKMFEIPEDMDYIDEWKSRAGEKEKGTGLSNYLFSRKFHVKFKTKYSFHIIYYTNVVSVFHKFCEKQRIYHLHFLWQSNLVTNKI